MRAIIILTKVNGFEMYRVYNENGYQGQRWSLCGAEQLAHKIMRDSLK